MQWDGFREQGVGGVLNDASTVSLGITKTALAQAAAPVQFALNPVQGVKDQAAAIRAAYDQGGMLLVVNQFNPVYQTLQSGSEFWEAAKAGCLEEAGAAGFNLTMSAVSTAAIGAGGAATIGKGIPSRTGNTNVEPTPDYDEPIGPQPDRADHDRPIGPEEAQISGTNQKGQVTSRSSFRVGTLHKTWAEAEDGPNGGKLCYTCGKEMMVPPNTGVPRDWDASHNPSWTNRGFPPNIDRKSVIDNYNEGIILECPSCNRGGGNNDERFGK